MATIHGDSIFDGFEPMSGAPHSHDEHDLALPSDDVREITPAAAPALNPEQIAPSEDEWMDLATEAALEPAPIFNSEPVAQIEDGWLDTASGATTSTVIEPNNDLVPHEARDSEAPDSLPDSEPPLLLYIRGQGAPQRHNNLSLRSLSRVRCPPPPYSTSVISLLCLGEALRW